MRSGPRTTVTFSDGLARTGLQLIDWYGDSSCTTTVDTSKRPAMDIREYGEADDAYLLREIEARRQNRVAG